MDPWIGACRSNYFKIKDPTGFTRFLTEFGANVLTNNELYGFTANGSGASPSLTDASREKVREIYQEIHTHLADGEICVIMEVGSGKLQYLTGWAMAIHPNGDRVELNLDDIYTLAEEKFGKGLNITKVAF